MRRTWLVLGLLLDALSSGCGANSAPRDPPAAAAKLTSIQNSYPLGRSLEALLGSASVDTIVIIGDKLLVSIDAVVSPTQRLSLAFE
jgi:hypothetical protein